MYKKIGIASDKNFGIRRSLKFILSLTFFTASLDSDNGFHLVPELSAEYKEPPRSLTEVRDEVNLCASSVDAIMLFPCLLMSSYSFL